MAKQFMKVYYDLFDLKLSASDVLIVAYVMQFGEKGCRTINKNIANKFNISLKTTQTAIKSLVNTGLIREEYEHGKRVMYFDSENYSKLRSKMLLESVKKKNK